jgi:CHAD domain-containing protein
VAPAVGEDAERLAAVMEEVQELLGDHQDSVVERGWLRDLGVRAHLAGESGFTFGRLHALAEARAVHDEEAFAGTWRAAAERAAAWPG